MGSSQIMFFAAETDFSQMLDEIESKFEIKYVGMGRFENRNIPVYETYHDIPNFGYTDFGDWAGPDHRYLILPKQIDLNLEAFKLSSGSEVYLADMKLNPDSVELTSKGVYRRKERVVVAGRIAKVANGAFADPLYKAFTAEMRKRFRRIGSYYVGPNAEEKLRNGWRLVQIESSPREFDLAIPFDE
jgi:hypothetical protein